MKTAGRGRFPIMFRPIRGMKDLYGIPAKKYRYIINTARRIGEKYGYSEIKTPIVEATDVFQRSIGDETDVVSKEMYSFVDKGGESITLRPEGTAGVMRAIVSENLGQNFPIKLMYYGEMFRYDRPQKGRYRQFHQVGFECIGDKSPYTDAILICMATEILNAVGIFNTKVLINTLGDDETREAYTKGLAKYLSRHEEKLSDDSKRRLGKNPLRILDSKDEHDREICQMAPLITDYLSKESEQYFQNICRLLENAGINFEIDNFLVRGLDYYSETAFEFKSTNAEYRDSVGGGGRYDKLLSIFGGTDASGIGFAFGIERLMLLMDDAKFKENAKKVAVVPVTEEENEPAFQLLKSLYDAEISAEFIHIGNLSKKMKVADKLNCPVAIILGEDEIRSGNFTVKFMNCDNIAEKTKLIAKSDLISFIKHNL